MPPNYSGSPKPDQPDLRTRGQKDADTRKRNHDTALAAGGDEDAIARITSTEVKIQISE